MTGLFFFSFFLFFLKKLFSKKTKKVPKKKNVFLKIFLFYFKKTMEFLTGLFFSFFGFFLKKLFSKKTKKVPKKNVFLKIFLFYFRKTMEFLTGLFFFRCFFSFFFLKKFLIYSAFCRELFFVKGGVFTEFFENFFNFHKKFFICFPTKY